VSYDLKTMNGSLVIDMWKKLEGKCVLLFGEPASGKSYALCRIAKELLMLSGKKAYLIWTDTNLFGDYGKELESFCNAEIYRVTSVTSLLSYKLPDIYGSREFNYSFMAIDSISGLEEQVTAGEKLGSPRRNLLLSQLSRNVTYWGSKIAQKFGIPVIITAHSTPMIEGTWHGLDVRPAFTRRAMKNVDVILQHKNDGRIVWKVVLWRSLDWKGWSGKEVSLDELLKGIKPTTLKGFEVRK